MRTQRSPYRQGLSGMTGSRRKSRWSTDDEARDIAVVSLISSLPTTPAEREAADVVAQTVAQCHHPQQDEFDEHAVWRELEGKLIAILDQGDLAVLHPGAHYALALLLATGGAGDLAIPHLEELVAQDPGFPGARAFLEQLQAGRTPEYYATEAWLLLAESGIHEPEDVGDAEDDAADDSPP